MNVRSPETSIVRLATRFNFAFGETHDLQTAMAAVNEILERPLTYQEFFTALRK